MDDLEYLFESAAKARPRKKSYFEGPLRSEEFDRIFTLPYRKLDVNADLNGELQRPGATLKLWPVQSVALQEARESNGLFGAIGVGHGKSLIAALLPTVMDSKRAVILTEPQLVPQVVNLELPKYAEHFNVRRSSIQVISYSTLSVVKGASLLDDICPDLIVADEAHNLRCRDSVRTKRFLRFFAQHPGTRFCCLSGTIASKSILDYEHLIRLALGRGSPLPNEMDELLVWAAALDPGDSPAPAGELIRLCKTGESVRSGFRRRLIGTKGVVATKRAALGTSLRLVGRHPVIPPDVQEALDDLRATWTRPDGEEIADALRFSAVARQMASGFYYRWDWPDNVADDEWLEARKLWNRELRQILKLSRPGMDSPMLVARAASLGNITPLSWGRWARVKDRWRIKEDVKPRLPTVEAPGIIGIQHVWISDFLVRDVTDWVRQNSPALVWYTDRCVGARIKILADLPAYGAGLSGTAGLLAELKGKRARTVVLSQQAHGTGKNLQGAQGGHPGWSTQIFTSVASDATEWEQVLGRTHRPGQQADTVIAAVYRHTPELRAAFDTAVERAKFVQETKGQRMKLCFADRVGF
jgi:hypothetical protein